ncbi:MAG TPA: SPOR domain-containing protein [Pseudomonas sp.]|nr:SPOR domain-containing protein [Pseudomonas sp.]
MALLDRKLTQRIVGAAVLVALVVVFLPMLFNREDEQRRVRVEAPPMPAAPAVVVAAPEPVAVPEPQVEAEAPASSPEPAAAPPVRVAPPKANPTAETSAATPAGAARAPAVVPPTGEPQPQAPSRLDADGVPISWSIQLASLSSRPRAEELQKKLRGQGLTAYIRSVDGMHRVFVGPLLDRAEAERLGGQLARQHRLTPIVLRFQPERR